MCIGGLYDVLPFSFHECFGMSFCLRRSTTHEEEEEEKNLFLEHVYITFLDTRGRDSNGKAVGEQKSSITRARTFSCSGETTRIQTDAARPRSGMLEVDRDR